MHPIELLGRLAADRGDAEHLISSVFLANYGASLAGFPETIAAKAGPDGRFVCAAGLRFAGDGFFSECYLDGAVEEIIVAQSGQFVARERIFEVSSLASRDPGLTLRFIGDIVRYGQQNGFEWCFFTLTRRLARMLTRMGLAPLMLAPADRQRMAGFQRWGSYYDHEPAVFALANPGAVRPVILPRPEAGHALSL